MRILNIFCRLKNKAYVILLIKSDVSFQVKTSQRDILQQMKFNYFTSTLNRLSQNETITSVGECSTIMNTINFTVYFILCNIL